MGEPRLSVEDAVVLRETVSAMTDEQVWRTLEDLANREIELLDNPVIGGDPELRQASLWNAAAMISAAERFVTQVRDDPTARTSSTTTETSGAPPEGPPPPRSGSSPSG